MNFRKVNGNLGGLEPHPSCLTAIHLPHTIRIYKFFMKTGGEGLAARRFQRFEIFNPN